MLDAEWIAATVQASTRAQLGDQRNNGGIADVGVHATSAQRDRHGCCHLCCLSLFSHLRLDPGSTDCGNRAGSLSGARPASTGLVAASAPLVWALVGLGLLLGPWRSGAKSSQCQLQPLLIRCWCMMLLPMLSVASALLHYSQSGLVPVQPVTQSSDFRMLMVTGSCSICCCFWHAQRCQHLWLFRNNWLLGPLCDSRQQSNRNALHF